MARLCSVRTLKSAGLLLCALGSLCILFVTDFPRSLVKEIDLDALAQPLSHSRSHQHNRKHNHEHGKPIQNGRPIVRYISKVKEHSLESFPKSSMTVTTSIVKNMEGHTIDKAYGSQGFFWGMFPKPGDYIEIVFNKPKLLSHIVIPSGHKEHENDAFLDSHLSISTDPHEGRCVNYRQVARFRDKKIVEHRFKNKKLIHCVRLTLSNVRMVKNMDEAYWLIISGITLT